MGQIVIGALVPNGLLSESEMVRITIKPEFRPLYRGKVTLANGRDVADIEGLHVRGQDMSSFETGFLLNGSPSLFVAIEHVNAVVMKPTIPILGEPREPAKYVVMRD